MADTVDPADGERVKCLFDWLREYFLSTSTTTLPNDMDDNKAFLVLSPRQGYLRGLWHRRFGHGTIARQAYQRAVGCFVASLQG